MPMYQRKIGKKLLITCVISLIVCSALLIGQVSSNASACPSKIEIFVGPPSLPADNGTYRCVFVELQDVDGNPVRALQDTSISLSSSRTEIGTVDTSISIAAGETFGAANFYATFTSGNTMIAAAATGYSTVQAQVSTVGPKPYTIAVYGFPATLPANGGSYEAVLVQLQDVHGSPARAPKGGTQVYLSCSNTLVGDVTPSVTIPEGQTYAKATFQTTTTPGEATITTIAGDYISSNTKITTTDLATNAPSRLSISTGSPKVLADNSAYTQIAVQLQDQFGNLVAAPSDITVTIASADQSIGRTETHLIIPQSQTYALATFHSTYKAGTTNITAAATNLIATQQPFNTTGFTASALAVYCVPSTMPADNGGYQTVQVQLQDVDGNPAQAPDMDLNVKLFSSNPTVGLVSSKVTIPLGKTWATGTLTATNSPGTTTITAQASSYTPGEADATTYIIDFASLHVNVTSEAKQVLNGNDTTITAYITALGKPVTGAEVTFTSDNGGTFTETQENPTGYYTAIFTAPSFSTTTTCTITANASKTDFIDSHGTVQVAVGPTVPTTTNSTPVTLLLRVLDNQGNFLVDVLVSSTAQPAGIAALSGVTNETGDVVFQNLTAGSYVFQISKDGYATLEQPVEYTGKAMAMVSTLQTGSGQGDNTWILVGIIVVFAVVFTVIGIGLAKRRRKQPTKGLSPLTWPTSTH